MPGSLWPSAYQGMLAGGMVPFSWKAGSWAAETCGPLLKNPAARGKRIWKPLLPGYPMDLRPEIIVCVPLLNRYSIGLVFKIP